MTYHIKDRVLHYIYTELSSIPRHIIDVCDAYEGAIKDRVGFNFPMSIVKKVDPKSPLLAFQAEYVIAYRKGDILTKRHELQHAKYHLNREFREEVRALWDSSTKEFQQSVLDRLLQMKYPNDMAILLDEFQAYHFTERAFWEKSKKSLS